MNTFKAIETRYKGYRFRSRLEARWAVYFDAVGLRWEYEPEGFLLGRLGPYLPDFWLPDVQHWCEVKPTEFTRLEFRKCRRLVIGTGKNCVLLVGAPAPRAYATLSSGWKGTDGSVVLNCDYLHERRFYSFPGCLCHEKRDGGCDGCSRDDTAAAAIEAISARFEHNERK